MEPLKNNFSPELVMCIAGHLSKHLTDFNKAGFETAILSELDKLELKERIQLIADNLHASLPHQHKVRNSILLAMLHPEKNPAPDLQSNEQGIHGWGVLPLCAVVGQHGTSSFEGSLEVLKQMTRHFSSELDVRYFLLADQKRALGIMAEWINHPSHHVRRLVSEGTRPRLPWAMQLPSLIADPSPALPLLNALKDDKEEYVRRSVANHLNDISKDHPDLVVKLAKKWIKNASENRKKLLRHGCRTLIKQGHSGALAIFGFAEPQIELSNFLIGTPAIEFGKNLNFSVRVQSTSKAKQSLVIDYVLHFKKSNGKLSPKVFKWKILILEPNQDILLTRAHAIKPITTRKYYSGQHALSLRINGRDYGLENFDLKC
ncbi:MAG: DNA alkylation repair protein [Methyloligellaceae bacterium]